MYPFVLDIEYKGITYQIVVTGLSESNEYIWYVHGNTFIEEEIRKDPMMEILIKADIDNYIYAMEQKIQVYEEEHNG